MADQTQSVRRRVYLKMSSVESARADLDRAMERLELGPRRLETEILTPIEALGRVTAAAVFAGECNPHYCASAMDGFSVLASATNGASEASPKCLEIPEQAKPINTGAPLPQGHDAVIMIEDVHEPREGVIEIMAAASPWHHVRLLGEDIVATELIVTAGQKLGPVEIAAMVASQVESVDVVPRPKVALLPTGTEVVRPSNRQRLADGQVIDYDTPMLSGMIESWGGQAVVHEPIPDEPDRIRDALLAAAEKHDLVALIAGSSAGTADHVPNLIEEHGELLFHGVRLSPGKPTALGIVADTLVIGVPGYSVAAWTAFELFAKPILAQLQGLPLPVRERVAAVFRRKVPSRSGMYELLRVRLARVGGDIVAAPLKRGSGAISSLTQADGLAHVSELDEGVNPNEPVSVELLIPASDIERTVLAVGSHDIALDMLAAELALRPEHFRLASAHVGSMGGLRALRQGEAHLAGIHLLNPRDGTYNVSYIQQILPDLPLRLINLVHRQVGLMVLPGNPKSIKTVRDLTREDVVMINRQRGAGTRVLLDHLLECDEIQPVDVIGYPREVTTHTMVAAAVWGGAADTGLGIRAAALGLGLDFVPITTERYDIAIPTTNIEHPGMIALLDIITSSGVRKSRFKDRVRALGGYGFEEMGTVIYEQ